MDRKVTVVCHAVAGGGVVGAGRGPLTCPARPPVPARNARDGAITFAARLLSLRALIVTGSIQRREGTSTAHRGLELHDDAPGITWFCRMTPSRFPAVTRSVRAAAPQAVRMRPSRTARRPWLPEAQAHTRAPPWHADPRVDGGGIGPPTRRRASPPGSSPGLLEHAARCHKRYRYDNEVVGPLPRTTPSAYIVEHDTIPVGVENGHRQRHRTSRSQSYLATEAPTRPPR